MSNLKKNMPLSIPHPSFSRPVILGVKKKCSIFDSRGDGAQLSGVCNHKLYYLFVLSVFCISSSIFPRCHNLARVLFSSCFISRLEPVRGSRETIKNAMASCFSFLCLVILFALNFFSPNIHINTVVMICFPPLWICL